MRRLFPFIVLTALAVGAACGDEFTSETGGTKTVVTDEMCTRVDDCTVPEDPCIDLSCQNNRCTHNPRPEFDPVDEGQVDGDCNSRICSDGQVIDRFEREDVPVTEECEYAECVRDGNDVRVNVLSVTAGQPCGENGNHSCDGNGLCVGCMSTAECGNPMDPCKTVQCNASQECVFEHLSEQPAPEQTPGDCELLWCDAMSALTYTPDDSDVPMDLNPLDCAMPACENGILQMRPVDDGSPCEKGGVRQCCNGMCCAGDTSCNNGTCEANMP